MTSLQRAAAYLKKAGPKAALAIVPLAMAVPSHASILFNYGSGNWNVQTTGNTLISPISESISGVPLTGSLLQGFDLAGSKIISWDSGGTITVTGTWSGTGTGTNQVFPTSTIKG